MKIAPVLIILQEAYGMNKHMQNVAERFAKEGYLPLKDLTFAPI
jgi:dienelactone hydrolase